MIAWYAAVGVAPYNIFTTKNIDLEVAQSESAAILTIVNGDGFNLVHCLKVHSPPGVGLFVGVCDAVIAPDSTDVVIDSSR